MKTKFSVLVSVYAKERPEYLCEAVESVFNQTVMPDELILVEDGPLTDGLYSVLDNLCSKFPQIRRIPLAVNSGLGKALNEGLKHCSNELVARMDSDDIAKIQRFEKQLAIFNQYDNVEVVSSWINEFIDSPDNPVSTRKLPEFHYQIVQYAKKRCPINHPAVMFRKSSISLAGGYQNFPLFEDYYLWIRLLMNGAKFYNIQESLLNFRVSSNTFKRRGGWKHAVTELRFQRCILRMGFINFRQFLYNTSIRFTMRIIPNSLRSAIYKRLLRCRLSVQA